MGCGLSTEQRLLRSLVSKKVSGIFMFYQQSCLVFKQSNALFKLLSKGCHPITNSAVFFNIVQTRGGGAQQLFNDVKNPVIWSICLLFKGTVTHKKTAFLAPRSGWKVPQKLNLGVKWSRDPTRSITRPQKAWKFTLGHFKPKWFDWNKK